MIKKFCITITFLFLALIGSSFLNKVHAAEFFFSPSNYSLNATCNYQIPLFIDTEGVDSNAADIIITYNPSEIDILDSNGSTSGTQIGTGNAYEIYLGNQVDEGIGRIRLAGTSISSYLNGQRTFANIALKSLPGITTSTMQIQFTGTGNTLDSNIAEATTSLDILDAVTNVTLNFANGACFVPTDDKPTITFVTPKQGDLNVDPNSNVEIIVSDDNAIDLSTLIITINGKNYTINSAGVTYTGSPQSYTIKIDPTETFPTGSGSTIRVEVKDFNGNEAEAFINFNIPGECPSTEPVTVVETDPDPTIIREEVPGDCDITYENIVETGDYDTTFDQNAMKILLNPNAPLALLSTVVVPYTFLTILVSGFNFPNLAALFLDRKDRFGMIINATNNDGISFANVDVTYPNGTNNKIKSDVDGQFYVDPTAETASLIVEKPGFEKFSTNVDIKHTGIPIVKLNPIDATFAEKLINASETGLKFFIYLTPYLLGVGLGLSLITGLINYGTVLTPYTITNATLICIRVIGRLVR